MRRIDEPMDPEIADALEAIDATLHGDPVDPIHAELAELALLVRAQRPEPELGFAAELDQRVRERFAARGEAAAPVRGSSRRWWVLAPAAGLAASVAVAVVIVVTQSSGSTGGGPVRSFSVASSAASAPSAAVQRASTNSASGHTAGTVKAASGTVFLDSKGVAHAPANGVPSLAANAPVATTATTPSAPVYGPAVVLAPLSNGRKITQSGELSLTTAASRIDAVAQEVFDVAGRENAIVQNSTVTEGQGGYAQIQLSIPSGSLSQAMAELSSLPYAHVSSRTDQTQDVNNQYESDVRALSDARALRTALLHQLANATSTAQVDSLTAQIHDAEASISSDEATLRGLNHQIDYSQVDVTINGGVLVTASGHKSTGGFSISKGAHDAGRVLTVAAGVALIAAAAAVPIALLGALAMWVALVVLRRRREHALDLA